MAVDELGEMEELRKGSTLIDPVRLQKELRCGACGYGIVVRNEPPVCPMCGADRWEEPVRLPFGF